MYLFVCNVIQELICISICYKCLQYCPVCIVSCNMADPWFQVPQAAAAVPLVIFLHIIGHLQPAA